MNSGRIARITLRVESLRQAENLYTRLFCLKVAWREGETADGLCELPGHLCWEEIAVQDIMPRRSVLLNDGICLNLCRDTVETNARGRLDGIGLNLEPQDFAQLWEQVGDLGCQVIEAADRRIIFDDPYSVRWEVHASPPPAPIE